MMGAKTRRAESRLTRLFFACLSLGLVVLVSGRAHANGLPIQGDTAFTTGLSGAGVRSFIKTSVTPTDSGAAGSGAQVKWVAPVVLLHELLDNKLILSVALPFVAAHTFGAAPRPSGFGLGGLNLAGKVNLFQKDAKNETFRVAAKLGVGLPTDLAAFFGDKGVLRPSMGGPSTPSVSISFIVTKLMGRFGVNGDVGLTVQPKVGSTDPSDLFKYNASFAYRAWPTVFETYPDHQVNLLIEANGVLASQIRNVGLLDDKSRTNTLFISPGIQYMYGQMLLEASLQVAAPYLSSGTDFSTLPVTTALFGVRWLVF